MNTTPRASFTAQVACLRLAVELGRAKLAVAAAGSQPGGTIPVPSKRAA